MEITLFLYSYVSSVYSPRFVVLASTNSEPWSVDYTVVQSEYSNPRDIARFWKTPGVYWQNVSKCENALLSIVKSQAICEVKFCDIARIWVQNPPKPWILFSGSLSLQSCHFSPCRFSSQCPPLGLKYPVPHTDELSLNKVSWTNWSPFVCMYIKHGTYYTCVRQHNGENHHC
jgi:hypothetical protein